MRTDQTTKRYLMKRKITVWYLFGKVPGPNRLLRANKNAENLTEITNDLTAWFLILSDSTRRTHWTLPALNIVEDVFAQYRTTTILC